MPVLRDVALAGGRRWDRERVIPKVQHHTSNFAGIFHLSSCEVKRLSHFLYKMDLKSFHCIRDCPCATIPPKSVLFIQHRFCIPTRPSPAGSVAQYGDRWLPSREDKLVSEQPRLRPAPIGCRRFFRSRTPTPRRRQGTAPTPISAAFATMLRGHYSVEASRNNRPISTQLCRPSWKSYLNTLRKIRVNPSQPRG